MKQSLLLTALIMASLALSSCEYSPGYVPAGYRDPYLEWEANREPVSVYGSYDYGSYKTLDTNYGLIDIYD